MSHPWLVCACAALALASVAPALAQSAAAPGPSATALTLERALVLSDQYSPRLRAALAQSEGARAGILTARAYPNPDIEALGGYQGSRRGYDSPEGAAWTLGLNQPLDLPNVREPRIRAAEAGFEGTRLALGETRLAVRATVKQSFYEVLRRRAELELALDNQKLLEDVRRRIAVRVDVGDAPKLELTRAEAESATAETAVQSARLRVARAHAALRAAIGAPLSPDTEIVGELRPAPALPPLEQLREEVFTNYPAIAVARADVRRAEARLETERALRVPQPSLRAGIQQQPEQNTFLLGIGLPIPVWNQRQGPIGEAVAALQESTANAERRRLELGRALEDAYERYQVATRQIAAFEGGLLRQAEAALSVAEAAYRFGERGFIEVLDAQRVLRSVRLDFLAARYEQQAALIDLEQLRALDLAENRP